MRGAAGVVEEREQLLTRREDIYAALRALERDRVEGTIDDAACNTARRRYELEAAAILERLDELDRPGDDDIHLDGRGRTGNIPTVTDSRAGMVDGRTRTEPLSLRRRGSIIWLAALALVAAAAAIFLIDALHARGNGAITGDARAVVSTPAPATSTALLAAEKQVKLHPASVDAYLDLGNAYLNANQPAAADRAFVRAIRLAPSRPEARTMHALIMAGSSARPAQSLALLRRVETGHPAYSHAWLVDGLLSSRSRTAFPRAIAAFHRFLALAPHAPVSPQVRAFLAGLERAERQPTSGRKP
jgi:tetratricopeptide (TPR) repeat protein